MLFSLLARLCRYLKHYVLDFAHPLPRQIYVYPGEGLERSIVQTVVCETDLHGLVLMDREEGSSKPSICLEADGLTYTGAFSIARFLARLWRIYPTTPQNALEVDSALEDLQAFVRPFLTGEARTDAFSVSAWTVAHVRTFEETYMTYEDEPWIYGFSSRTLADVCWFAVLRYLQTHEDFEVDEDLRTQFPRFAEWWDELADDDDSTATTEGAEEEEEEEAEQE